MEEATNTGQEVGREEAQTQRRIGRRELLQALAASSGAAVASALLPGKWAKPVVEVGVLPAHAQVTPIEVTHGSQTLDYTGSEQQFTVPAGITSGTIEAYGAQGGAGFSNSFGGNGGFTGATIAVTPGETLYVYVGGVGGDQGGFCVGGNGGGNGGDGGPVGSGGGGGGASDVRQGGNALANRVVVAGGGGGGGTQVTLGGAGGGTTAATGGTSGVAGSGAGGGGGTQAAGGGGGGGGGGASGTVPVLGRGGGGGGGSSFPASATHTQGARRGRAGRHFVVGGLHLFATGVTRTTDAQDLRDSPLNTNHTAPGDTLVPWGFLFSNDGLAKKRLTLHQISRRVAISSSRSATS